MDNAAKTFEPKKPRDIDGMWNDLLLILDDLHGRSDGRSLPSILRW